MLGLTKLYPEQENALFHFLSRKNVFVQIFRRAILLQVDSRNRVHSLKHTASLLLLYIILCFCNTVMFYGHANKAQVLLLLLSR